MKIIIKRIITVGIILVATFTSTTSIADLSINVSLASNYVSNGISQTDDKPAIQGGLVFEYTNGLYLGTWVSTVNNGLEVDVYAGYLAAVKNVEYDIGFLTYNYTNSAFSNNSKEIYVGIIYENVSLYYSTDHNALSGYKYVDISANFNINDSAKLKIHYGLIEYDTSSENYYDYSLSINKSLKSCEVSFTHTAAEFSDDDKFFVSVSKSFDL